MDIKIVFHPSGDWEGLYLNGYLEHEGHDTSVEDLINALNKSCSNLEAYEQFYYDTRDLGNEEGFDEDFSFPLKYEDIDREKADHAKDRIQNQIDRLTKELESL